MEEKTICEKCGEIHLKCHAHPKLKNSADGIYHPCGKEKVGTTDYCYMHGGTQPVGVFSPNYKHGRKSKYLNDVKGKRRKLLDASATLPHKLPTVLDNIDLEEMRLRELLQMLDQSNLIDHWTDIKFHFSAAYELHFNPPEIVTDEEFREPEEILREMMGDELKTLKRLFADVSANEKLFNKIDDKNERLRKFQETNAKLRAANVDEMIAKQKLVPVEIFRDFNQSVAKVFHQVPDDLRHRLLNDLEDIFLKLPRYIQDPLLLEE